MFDEAFIQRAIIAAPAILFALTVHEFFHAWTAMKFGDNTAKNLGRLTLNPLAHLDLFGTIMFFASSFMFGWAKPVPVNPFNLRNPRVADFWISAAGPISNFGLAIIFGAIFRTLADLDIPEGLYRFLRISVIVNLGLACFNLIPLFPLDGSHILRNILPESYGPALDRFESISPFILIILIILGAFAIILGPMIYFFFQLLTGTPIY